MTLRASLLVLALLGAPSVAWAGAPDEARVRVAADEIGIMKPEQLESIADEATKLAEQEGIAPSEMSVSLVWADRDALVYGIRVRIVTDEAKVVDAADERGPIVQRCEDCSEGDLVTASIEGVLEAISQYREAKAPPPAPAKVVPDPVVVDDDVPAPDAAPPDRGLGKLGKAGVAAIAVGGAGAITGAVLIGVGTTRPQADPTLLREFRPTGYVVLGVGVAVLVTGAVLLAVDRKRAKRDVSVAPAIVPGFVGLSARARF